ncbi:MAG: DUF3883 domain-containing protein [Candidatus Aenigmatarchaeota archaeon]
MTNAKQYIQDIKNRILASDKEFALDGYAGSIEAIQKAFPRYGSFLMEFIQNADDAKSKSVRIEIFQDSIKILNDGLPFSQEDVKSICKVGRSSKTAKDYIGYLGVGFKAVFLISDCPEIYSGEYRFKFDKSHFSEPNIPWQVIPLWIDNPQIELPDGFNTVFNLPLKSISLVETLRDEIKPEHLSDRILLFLRYIEKLELIDHTQNFKRRIVKSKVSETSDFEIYEIQEYENDNLKNQDRWLIFRSSCQVPENVKHDLISKEWGRDKVDKREVIVAFKLDKENSLVKEEKGTAHIGVFSFLPLKEIQSGLNFLIQADFLTMTGRGELARECLWNNWLADEIYNLIVSKCIPTFLKDERWKMNFTEILYSSEGGHELFERKIKGPLREYLEREPVLIGEDGYPIKADEAIDLSNLSQQLLSKLSYALTKLYPNKKVVDPRCKFPREIGEKIKHRPTYRADLGLNYQMLELVKFYAEQKDIEFFKALYYDLSQQYDESTLRNSSFKYENILLTDTWELVNARTAYIKPQDLSIPPEVKKNFKIIHPELSADGTILQFLKILGVKELTKEHIENILKIEIRLSKEWETLSKEEKIRWTKICKGLWENHKIDIRDLGFLTLLSKSGEWLKPADLTFSKEYTPDHRIEELTEKGLLKSEDLQRLNIKFLSDEYIKDTDNIESWRNFFKELGIEQNLNKKKVVERIGINIALCFEAKNGRNARELSRSEEFDGYDIELNSGERLIEVKARSDPSPLIVLTSKQYKKLQSEGEKYFLYVIRDALKNPILSVIKGSKLFNVDNYSISIGFYIWKNLTEEDFQP